MSGHEPISGRQAPRWATLLATGFGSGLLRPASGTWGSLGALLAWLFLTFLWATPLSTWVLRHPQDPLAPWVMAAGEAGFLVLLVGLTALGVRAADAVVNATGEQDPGRIVVDEWVGMWFALWPLRWMIAKDGFQLFTPGGWRLAVLLAVPFLAFRCFDILKPWPVRQLEDLPGGQGIVADDLVAGLYALLLTELLRPFVMMALA